VKRRQKHRGEKIKSSPVIIIDYHYHQVISILSLWFPKEINSGHSWVSFCIGHSPSISNFISEIQIFTLPMGGGFVFISCERRFSSQQKTWKESVILSGFSSLTGIPPR
jgi:hypothetical protein